MLQVLMNQHEQQANVNVKGDPQLTNLAMLKSKKPRREFKKMMEMEDNQVLNDYIADLKGARAVLA